MSKFAKMPVPQKSDSDVGNHKAALRKFKFMNVAAETALSISDNSQIPKYLQSAANPLTAYKIYYTV